jgi:hypothetical protein
METARTLAATRRSGKHKRRNEEERPASGAARAAKSAAAPARNKIPAWLDGRCQGVRPRNICKGATQVVVS